MATPGFLSRASHTPTIGPLVALVVAVVVFATTTETFFTLDNMSLMLQQVLVIGTLAVGQSIIILTAGIDLANAAIMVLATLVIAKLAATTMPALPALLLGLLLCMVLAAVSGLLVSRLTLPPFIVTLGMLSALTATSQLFANGQSFEVDSKLLAVLGTGTYLFGGFRVTVGMIVMLAAVVIIWFALTQTTWGRHVYAAGDDREAARLNGINVRRTILSVYVIAGLFYALAAWQAFGRIPNADPNAFQTGNLDSITAVVIGGTSLFGGRGGVVGTVLGALIVTVLTNGLTQAGIDSLYQQVATGVMVIAAVGVDRLVRRRAK